MLNKNFKKQRFCIKIISFIKQTFLRFTIAHCRISVDIYISKFNLIT